MIEVEWGNQFRPARAPSDSVMVRFMLRMLGSQDPCLENPEEWSEGNPTVSYDWDTSLFLEMLDVEARGVSGVLIGCTAGHACASSLPSVVHEPLGKIFLHCSYRAECWLSLTRGERRFLSTSSVL